MIDQLDAVNVTASQVLLLALMPPSAGVFKLHNYAVPFVYDEDIAGGWLCALWLVEKTSVGKIVK